jgi:SNF2 family DNA or RNA helicase
MGKTVQTIAFLSGQPQSKKILIICPASVISVWENELNKFNPTLGKKIGNSIQIMSYEKAVRSSPAKVDFLILDEAQKIKNNTTLSFKSIAKIQKKFAILLSGTPIENNISDLFSLLQILDNSSYELLYILKKAYSNDRELVDIVRKMIDPIYLQRKKTKDQLISELKIEEIKVTPTAFEKKLQEEIQTIFRDKLMREKANNNHDYYSVTYMLTGLMRLRQAVSNPKQLPEELIAHFTPKTKQDLENLTPSKIKEVKKIYSNIKERNEKVVIFTSFGKTLDLLKKELQQNGAHVLMLRGTDPNSKRKMMIEEFQKPNTKYDVFIISLKAGNTGITLTNANNVIVYDLWYNPAVIAQALARVHRIGQIKDVTAYLLILQNTVDQDINNIFLGKEELINKFNKPGSNEAGEDKSALTTLGKKLFLQ